MSTTRTSGVEQYATEDVFKTWSEPLLSLLSLLELELCASTPGIHAAAKRANSDTTANQEVFLVLAVELTLAVCDLLRDAQRGSLMMVMMMRSTPRLASLPQTAVVGIPLDEMDDEKTYPTKPRRRTQQIHAEKEERGMRSTLSPVSLAWV